jgi:hypothetical protein
MGDHAPNLRYSPPYAEMKAEEKHYASPSEMIDDFQKMKEQVRSRLLHDHNSRPRWHLLHITCSLPG